MKVLCLGGGPAGLYFAISMKLRDAGHQVTVRERSRANDTFGWGAVLSDAALRRMQKNDPASTDEIRCHFAYWDDIVVVHDGRRTVSGGHGFAGISRKQMLVLLQDRARALGIDLRFETEFDSAGAYRKDYDLVVACNGINSKVRKEYEEVFQPDIDLRRCKFVWLGTHQKFDDAVTFIFEKTEHGWVWAHVYQFDADTATFIVECLPETWDRWGFERMTTEETVENCRKIFERHLCGYALMSNAAHLRSSAVWMQFPRVICERWYNGNVVLMGDAAATGHCSIGSGSRLEFDSAIALADYRHSEPTQEAAFERYQEERRTEVLRLQSAARSSLEWFEAAERYPDLPPEQFAYSLLTRSQRISRENLRLRDPAWLPGGGGLVPGASRGAGRPLADVRPVSPARHGTEEPRGRLAHGAMQGRRGLPDGLAPRPLRRARQGRRGARLYRHDLPLDRRAHHPGVAPSYARPSMRPPGPALSISSTAKPRQRSAARSALPWSPYHALPRAMTRADMDRVRDEFVRATEMAARAGFDMVELHAAHGYLISSFISPVSALRTDDYGGPLEDRMRWPLEVFRATRAVWGERKPMSVRISANDWVGDHGRGQHHGGRSGQCDPAGGAGGSWLPRSPAPRRSVLDAARGGGTGRRGRGMAAPLPSGA